MSLLLLIHMLEAPSRRRAMLLGAVIGLAASAKYVGLMLVPFAVLVLLFGLSGSVEWRQRWRLAGLAAGAALVVLALVHLSVLWELAPYRASVWGAMRQAEKGVGVRAPLALTHGLFHLRQSLLPGLGVPLTMLGLLGLPHHSLRGPSSAGRFG